MYISLNGLSIYPGTIAAAPAAPTDVPINLVTSGVTSYALDSAKIFWHTRVPDCVPASAGQDGAPQVDQYPETISRIAAYGSPIRVLYYEIRNCGAEQILSNIAADADYLYWLQTDGLYRLSTDASIGDDPYRMNTDAKGYGKVAVGDDRVYALFTNSVGNKEIDYVMKTSLTRGIAWTHAALENLQADADYVYFIQDGALNRLTPGDPSPSQLASRVTGYFPEGYRVTCSGIYCLPSNRVYIGTRNAVPGGPPQIFVYNNLLEDLGNEPIYTSTDSGPEPAVIYDLNTTHDNLYFFEGRTLDCTGDPCLYTYSSVLYRALRSGATPEGIYATSPDPERTALANLRDYDGFIYWQDGGVVRRLPGDATALQSVDLWVDAIEVTQGIQDLSHSVILIKDKRTFVRVYARSQLIAIAGVTAKLEAPDIPGAEPLWPVNPDGSSITVYPDTNRLDLNQNFLFELPYAWTRQANLRLVATVNPFKVPLEPNYANNDRQVTVSFVPSPTFSAEFFRFNYSIGGVTYGARLEEDMVRAYDYIQRLYPLGGSPGEYFKPRGWDVQGGDFFGTLVDTTNPLCVIVYPDPKLRNLCASYFANGILKYYRLSTLINGGDLNPLAFFYGMITDSSGFFARGQAIGFRTSVGPTGIPGLGSGWDEDGTYGDWYAAHEIGHSLDRGHPWTGSDDPATPDVAELCHHSRTDWSYPYGDIVHAQSPIGPADGSIVGLDARYPEDNLPMLVLPSDSWNDIMSYCSNLWISDYTYEGMYSYMLANPSFAPESAEAASPAVTGDFLILSGMIDPDLPSGSFALVRRAGAVRAFFPVAKGQYSVRLRGGLNQELATELVETEANDDLGILNFEHVMNFAAGTRKVELVRNSDGMVLATQLISANPPVVSNVHLQVGTPEPASGVVTLEWEASDPDSKGGLTFDVAYSRDNGASYAPVMIGLTATSAQIDTARLGGTSGAATARFRVIASDVANAAQADSPAFVMADRTPEPYILTPQGSLYVRFGQLINFSGMALDAQDGTVAPSGLEWRDGDGHILGTGPRLSIASLPVGLNLVSFRATNSAGRTASRGVWVHVSDDLVRPDPTLTAGPGMVAWQVTAGSTALKYETVKIANAGSGSLTWTAADDAPWLTLSASGGTIAEGDGSASLVLTAHPAGLAPGYTYTADLVLTRPASGGVPEQVVTIPVNLSVGGVRNEEPQWPVYLPLLWR